MIKTLKLLISEIKNQILDLFCKLNPLPNTRKETRCKKRKIKNGGGK